MLTTSQLMTDSLEASQDPRVQRAVPRLNSSITRAVDLCERTLSFGKAEEPAPNIAPFKLKPMVCEIKDDVEIASKEKSIEIIINIDDDFTISGDSEQIFRVLGNLTRNARQILEKRPAPRCITIEARRKDKNVFITISDNGPGVPKAAREKLFKPFEGSVTTGGSGLGLAISAEIIRNHNGELTLASTSEKGTCFEIRLPD